ncbi:MAG: DNA recombination protein RmuC, partial [Myxococcales bacterium]|nr:DNA recombination protein RmuC [Myxococcales bacterium]
YAERVPGRSLDFVLMFVPLEAALVVALRQAPELLEESHRLGVLPVTPSNLLVTLKTIEHLWRTQRQQRNAEAIAERAGRLYDKLVGFVEDLGEVGRRLDQAKAAHERAVGKLSRGRGNLVRQAETLREMGAQSRHQLPHELREDDTLEAEPGAIGQEPTPRSPAHSA